MKSNKTNKAAEPATSVSKAATLGWPERIVQYLLLFFAATLPIYFDLQVPEVSGDPRWMAANFFAGLTALILLGAAVWRGKAQVSMRWPLVFWMALGVVIWSAVSLIDALNWMRGIILIKALYSYVLLMVVVWAVATPVFVRRLMWALVLPLAFTSFLGIAHFKGWTGASFNVLLNESILTFALRPVFDALGYLIYGVAHWWVPGWPDTVNFVDQITGYFLQSAVPGSTFANKNLAGSWTGMMLPIALYLLITSRRWSGQALASLLLGLGCVFLIYARARASWVALFASLVLLAALVVIVPAWRKAVWRHMNWWHAPWLMVPLLVVALHGGDVSPIHGAHAVDRTPGQQVAALAGSSWDEIGGRVAYNSNSLIITKDYWFNGVGLGSFFVVYPAYYNALVVTPSNSYSVSARPQRTHTDLMQAFDEMGLPGGVFYAGMFLAAIGMAFHLAGRRAGRLATQLVCAGVTSIVLLLILFLEYQGMLAIPEPMGTLVQMAMGAGIIWLLWRAWRNGVKVQRETAAADDVQLLGLMAGIGVLTIAINATMDFPMQLPTAPAAAALLMGAIAGVRHLYSPRLVGPHQRFTLPRPVLAGAFVVLAAAWTWALVDAVKFRQGNIYLKAAMVRVYSNIADAQTKALIDAAYAAYPLDPRIHEHLGVAYANYNGEPAMPIEEKIAKLEWVLKGDPWGANHLINLSGQYLALAEAKVREGKPEEANEALKKTEELYARLQRCADSSHFTWGIGGMIKLMRNEPQEAVSLFRRALTIQPNYAPAQSGLEIAQERMRAGGVSPVTVKDAAFGR